MSLETGLYTLELSDGKQIPLLIGVGTVGEFCDERKYSFLDMFQMFGEGSLSIKDVCLILFHGAMQWSFANKQPFTYTRDDAYEWMADIGVDSDEFKAVVALLKDVVGSLANGKKKKLKAV